MCYRNGLRLNPAGYRIRILKGLVGAPFLQERGLFFKQVAVEHPAFVYHTCNFMHYFV
jgi:hypothetical protein